MILFRWDGDHMVPERRFVHRCDREFVVGELYRMEAVEERSRASHNHYFAAVNEAWKNLPEDLAEQYPTDDHLRRRALIDAGFYDEAIIDCETERAAQNVAAFVAKRDGFALVIIRDQYVIVRTAKSQSVKAMGAKVFQASKQAVLDTIADMLSVHPAELAANAGAHA